MLLNAIAWTLVRGTDARLRDPERALALARAAVGLAPGDAAILDTLAVAESDAGNRYNALALANAALVLARNAKDPRLVREIEDHVKEMQSEGR